MYSYCFRVHNSGGVSTPVFNKTYCSYYFDGSSKYLQGAGNIGTLVSGSAKVWSYRVVFRRLTTGTEYLTANWEAGTNDKSWLLNFRGVDTLRFQFSTDGTTTSGNFTTNTAFTDTQWHEVIFTYNNGVMTSFVDGVEDTGTSTTIPTTVFTNSLDVLYSAGNLSNVPIYFEGYLNQINWTSDLITQTEATALWNGGSPRIGNELLDNMELQFLFDNDTFDGTDFTVIDDIAGNDGISVNLTAVNKDCNENPY